MAKELGRTPSQLFCVEDEVVAFQFDRAVWVWGQFIEAELAEVKEGKTPEATKRAKENRFKFLMGDQETKGRFKDPAGMF